MTTKMPRITFWRIVLTVILLAGVYSTWVRFTQGLGASTNLTDEFPWGLWIGFDVLCGVMLAAGGFTLMAAVHIFNAERFRPIVRPALLTAFLGYLLVIFALMFDLGRPWRIWHPLVMWNPRSVMFEVGWCVTLYTTVLSLEFAPMLFEKLRMKRPLRILKAVSIPLVIVGFVLSTLHQSSLGSLYLIVPEKLHPLWYTPLLPLFFFISALAVGIAMTLFESWMSHRHLGHQLDKEIVVYLGRILVVIVAFYTVLRFRDLGMRGAWGYAFAFDYESWLFLCEIGIGLIVPLALALFTKVRNSRGGLFVMSTMVVLGFMINRLNVGITGMEGWAGTQYVPKWTEIAVTVFIVAIGFVAFGLAAKHLPVFEPGHEHENENEHDIPQGALPDHT